MKILYKTQISFWHRIDNQPNLADKSCETDHYHEAVKLEIKTQVTNQFLDYKDVKKLVLEVLEKYDGQNITDKFGIRATEDLVKLLQVGLENSLGRPVDITIWETDKYGMELVSNQ